MSKANLERDKQFHDLAKAREYVKVTKSGRVFYRRDLGDTSTEAGRPALSPYRIASMDLGLPHTQISVHRLVYVVYYGLISDPTLEVNHKDGNKHNCNWRNLELVTSSGNRRHAVDTGLQTPLIGEDNGCAKLSSESALKYRMLYAKWKLTPSEIGLRAGLSLAQVSALLAGKTYRDVHMPEGCLERQLDSKKGEHSRSAKFTNKEVRRYRRLFAAGAITPKQVSELSDVHLVNVKRMLLGKSYVTA